VIVDLFELFVLLVGGGLIFLGVAIASLVPEREP
jgi:hypothetical protein